MSDERGRRMGRFLFLLHVPRDYTPGVPSTVEALNVWFASMGGDLVDRGAALGEVGCCGKVGDGTRLGGYLSVTAEDPDSALAVAEKCPFVGLGGGIEVALVRDTPAGPSGGPRG
jgi:hypothetical protein